MKTEFMMKCPACGATLSALSLSCPECGHILTEESESGKRARESLDALMTRLLSAETAGKKADIINTFTMPNTLDGLMQLLAFSYANFESSNGIESEQVTAAWLEKARLSYRLVKMRAGSDRSILAGLQEFAFLEDRSNGPRAEVPAQRKRRRTAIRWGMVLLLLGVILYGLLVLLSNLDGPEEESKTVQQAVMELVQEGKYDEARLKAAEAEYSWDRERLLEQIDQAENKQ